MQSCSVPKGIPWEYSSTQTGKTHQHQRKGLSHFYFHYTDKTEPKKLEQRWSDLAHTAHAGQG